MMTITTISRADVNAGNGFASAMLTTPTISKSATPIAACKLARSLSLARICRPSSASNKFEAGTAFSSSLTRQFYQRTERPTSLNR